MNKRITLGSNFYPSGEDDQRRQRAARDSWRNLPDVDLVDLQFESDPDRLEIPGFRRVEKLRQDSVRITGLAGKRKPVASEVFDLLAQEALAAGNELFAFSNADIILTPEMIARMDFDGETGADGEIIYQGQDTFVLDAQWWMENRRRFRPYILGESSWDNVYTSILLSHAAARLHNFPALIRHERHANAWYDSPFGAHNRFLLKLDSYYFTDWCNYCLQLDHVAADDWPAREPVLRKTSFTLRPSWRERLKCVARAARAFGQQWPAPPAGNSDCPLAGVCIGRRSRRATASKPR
jgi:hypothetical protein